MNEVLVENWNSRVSKKDNIVIIGDFAFKRHARWINILNGNKILIRGNHDKMSADIEKNFSSVHDILLRKINGQFICFLHYAMRTWPGPFMKTWHLYGHTHGRMPEPDCFRSCDVGTDVWGYAPVSFKMISEKMKMLESSESESEEKEHYEKRVIQLREQNTQIRTKFE